MLLFRHINFHNNNEALKPTSALRPHLHVLYCKRNYQCQCNISQDWNEYQRPQLIRGVGTMQAHISSSTRRQRQSTSQTCVLASSKRAKNTILFVFFHVQFSSARHKVYQLCIQCARSAMSLSLHWRKLDSRMEWGTQTLCRRRMCGRKKQEHPISIRIPVRIIYAQNTYTLTTHRDCVRCLQLPAGKWNALSRQAFWPRKYGI